MKQKLNISLDVELLIMLKDLAKQNNRTISNLIETVLIEWISKKKTS